MEIKTKYEMDQEVYVIYENKIRAVNIKEIKIMIYSGLIDIRYKLDFGNTIDLFSESKIFKTKEELINSL